MRGSGKERIGERYSIRPRIIEDTRSIFVRKSAYPCSPHRGRSGDGPSARPVRGMRPTKPAFAGAFGCSWETVFPAAMLVLRILKDPYVSDSPGIGEDAVERELKRALLDHIRESLLELGVGVFLHWEVGDSGVTIAPTSSFRLQYSTFSF